MTSSQNKTLFSIFARVAKFCLIFILVVYAFIWISSPYLAKHFAAKPLQELGVSLGENSTVRYNPFTSTLSVSDLEVLNEEQKIAASIKGAEISIHLYRLLFDQIYVSEFSLEKAMLKLTKYKDQLTIAGVSLPNQKQESQVAEPEEAEPPAYELIVPNLQVQEFLLEATIEGVQQVARLNDLKVKDTFLSANLQQMGLNIRAQLNDAPISIKATLDMSDGEGRILSEFSFEQVDVAKLSPLLADAGVEAEGLLSIKGNPEISIMGEQLNVISDQVVVSVDGLKAHYSPWVVENNKDLITLNNLNVEANMSGLVSKLSVNISTQFNQGNIALDERENSLLTWELIDLETDIQLIDMKPEALVKQIHIESIRLSQNLSDDEIEPLLSMKKLDITQIQFADQSLDIESVTVAGLRSDILINSDKSLTGLVDLSSLSPTDANRDDEVIKESQETVSAQKVTTDSAPKEEGLIISLGQFSFIDDAHIAINDQSVSPVFEQYITINKLVAGPFDSRDKSMMSPFELEAKDENYLAVVVDGKISPFSEQLSGVLQGKVSEVSLPSVSPYVKGALGFEMKSGQLDIGFGVDINADELSGETALYLRGLEMTTADDIEQGTIKEGKALPLNAALNLLKDSQGNIDLDIPLSGNVSDPSFGMQSLLGLVLKKAAMSQAKSYLMTTFVPYAKVVTVALSGAEYLLKIRFEPLVFQPGETQLNNEAQEYLVELVALMKDKPKLQLKTCAISTYDDLSFAVSTKLSKEQQTQLVEMGTERQNNLKGYLVEQGIASARILFCAPEIANDAEAKPRIELKTD